MRTSQVLRSLDNRRRDEQRIYRETSSLILFIVASFIFLFLVMP